MTQRQTSADIDEAAADWATRIDDAALDEAQQATFDAWLQGDIRRVGAYARARAVLVHAKRAKALGSSFEPAAFDPGASATDFAATDAPPAVETAPNRRRFLIGGGAAVAASAVAAVFLPIGRAAARTYETAKGEIRVLPMDDGSTVTLNSDSRISVRIDRSSRHIDLVRGEALFKVATGRPMPLTVGAGDTSLQTDGATFAICRIDREPLRLQVCDGAVEVARATAGAADRRTLRANMQAIMPANGGIEDRGIDPEALARDLAWQEGMLSFEDTPLSDAARAFARYSDRPIRIADPSVAAETVTGRYAANNPEGFAKAVAIGLNLSVRRTPDAILLGR